MTAIVDLAQARIDALYPDEKYNLKTGEFGTQPNLSSSGTKPTFFLFSLVPSLQGMPTLKELEELFLAEQSLNGVDSAEDVSQTETEGTFSEKDLNLLTLVAFGILFLLAIFCALYFYLCGLFFAIFRALSEAILTLF